MEGVYFGDKHSFKDYKLILSSFNNPLPLPKTYYIDVPGRNGTLDLSEHISSIRYERRTLTFRFASCVGEAMRYIQQSKILNEIHGKEMKIILDADKNYYYIGRINAKEWEMERDVAYLTIEVVAEPFKYDVLSSLDDWLWDSFSFVNGVIRQYKDLSIQGRREIVIPGSAIGVVPIITADSQMSVSFKGNTYSIGIGENKIYDIYLEDAESVLTFVGDGVVSIEYRGGSL